MTKPMQRPKTDAQLAAEEEEQERQEEEEQRRDPDRPFVSVRGRVWGVSRSWSQVDC